MNRRDNRLERLNQAGKKTDYWNHPPPRWKNCPKMGEIIEGLFLPFKTPLDGRYDAELTNEQKFQVEDVFDETERRGFGISAWMDLTKAKRFYPEQEKQSFNAHPETSYLKIACDGHDGPPTSESTRLFLGICEKYLKPSITKRGSVVAIHCTHGFNRTGFLICSYLVEKLDWSVDAALAAFSRSRPPGIYKAEYVRELYVRYEEIAPELPIIELPAWCYEEESADLDDDGLAKPEEEGAARNGESSSGGGHAVISKNAKFMEGVPEVDLVEDVETVIRIRSKCKEYCHWKGERDKFPGCQPVSMNCENIGLLAAEAFDVSWKADGVRYMLFIESTNHAFFVDRNNDVFQIHHMNFPKRPDTDEWIDETLLDGEMIFDDMPDKTKRARYLIYDIVHFRAENTGKLDFRQRCKRIQDSVIAPREEKARTGRLNKAAEPFSIRWKNFYPVTFAEKLLGENFSKGMSHEVDGLVFQPVRDPYFAGRCDKVLKWKPPEQCTVDFKLQVTQTGGKGMLVKTKGLLFVGGFGPSYGELKWSKAMRQYDKQILECSFDPTSNQWVFQRVRLDKTFPNHFTTAEAVMKGILTPLTKPALLQFIATRAVTDPPTKGHPSHQKRPQPEDPAREVDRQSVIKRVAVEGHDSSQRPQKRNRSPSEPRIY